MQHHAHVVRSLVAPRARIAPSRAPAPRPVPTATVAVVLHTGHPMGDTGREIGVVNVLSLPPSTRPARKGG